MCFRMPPISERENYLRTIEMRKLEWDPCNISFFSLYGINTERRYYSSASFDFWQIREGKPRF
ncbi:hypothetical protein DRO64_08325 [Candidatus Bathyarchaeota archaeon]|nr:MAG: hypothetical protein DRO64_08325 [Candidatus Bathyarchaeota archaeon]